MASFDRFGTDSPLVRSANSCSCPNSNSRRGFKKESHRVKLRQFSDFFHHSPNERRKLISLLCKRWTRCSCLVKRSGQKYFRVGRHAAGHAHRDHPNAPHLVEDGFPENRGVRYLISKTLADKRELDGRFNCGNDFLPLANNEVKCGVVQHHG